MTLAFVCVGIGRVALAIPRCVYVLRGTPLGLAPRPTRDPGEGQRGELDCFTSSIYINTLSLGDNKH